MTARTPLAQFLTDALASRGETPDQFAQRVGLNSSGLYKLLRGEYSEPRQTTVEKIAAGLYMTPGELWRAVESSEADPIEAYVRARIPEMREAVPELARHAARVLGRDHQSHLRPGHRRRPRYGPAGGRAGFGR